jgi:hypothetical protein
MTQKPRLLLTDAGAVIQAHRFDVWKHLCVSYDVVVPKLVVGEAAFFVGADSVRHPIDLDADLQAGTCQVYEAPVDEFRATVMSLPPQLRARVHDGELEALTYLATHRTDGVAFVTADAGAVEAAVVMGISDVPMSLEAALAACGITKTLPYPHTEAFISEARSRGGQTLVQFGMAIRSPKQKRSS